MIILKRFFFLFPVFVLLFLPACDGSTYTSPRIDALTGGTVELESGMEVEFPPGALLSNQVIKIDEEDEIPEGDQGSFEILGPVYDIRTKEGNFNVPITISIPYVEEEIPSNRSEYELFAIFFHEGEWIRPFSEVDPKNNRVIIKSFHASEWAIATDSEDNAVEQIQGYIDYTNISNGGACPISREAALELIEEKLDNFRDAVEEGNFTIEELKDTTFPPIKEIADEISSHLLLDAALHIVSDAAAQMGSKALAIKIGTATVAKWLPVIGGGFYFLDVSKESVEVISTMNKIQKAHDEYLEAVAMATLIQDPNASTAHPEYVEAMDRIREKCFPWATTENLIENVKDIVDNTYIELSPRESLPGTPFFINGYNFEPNEEVEIITEFKGPDGRISVNTRANDVGFFSVIISTLEEESPGVKHITATNKNSGLGDSTTFLVLDEYEHGVMKIGDTCFSIEEGTDLHVILSRPMEMDVTLEIPIIDDCSDYPPTDWVLAAGGPGAKQITGNSNGVIEITFSSEGLETGSYLVEARIFYPSDGDHDMTGLLIPITVEVIDLPPATLPLYYYMNYEEEAIKIKNGTTLWTCKYYEENGVEEIFHGQIARFHRTQVKECDNGDTYNREWDDFIAVYSGYLLSTTYEGEYSKILAFWTKPDPNGGSAVYNFDGQDLSVIVQQDTTVREDYEGNPGWEKESEYTQFFDAATGLQVFHEEVRDVYRNGKYQYTVTFTNNIVDTNIALGQSDPNFSRADEIRGGAVRNLLEEWLVKRCEFVAPGDNLFVNIELIDRPEDSFSFSVSPFQGGRCTVKDLQVRSDVTLKITSYDLADVLDYPKHLADLIENGRATIVDRSAAPAFDTSMDDFLCVVFGCSD